MIRRGAGTLLSGCAARALSSASGGGGGGGKVSPPARRHVPDDGVGDLRDFMARQRADAAGKGAPAAQAKGELGKRFYLETYGCQMNEADSQVVDSVLRGVGYERVPEARDADVLMMNTCAVREKAEDKIWTRLKQLRGDRQRWGASAGGRTQVVGVLGCMAERLKEDLLKEETLVNFIVGPDAYRDLPNLIRSAGGGMQAMNVRLSFEETYSDIDPQRPSGIEGVSAWLSIMRGCNNMCSFCVVPFTRGRERSRGLEGIVEEVRRLEDQGVREVTLLGQNVNSYWDKNWEGGEAGAGYQAASGFKNTYKLRGGGGARFVDLLDAVSLAAPQVRIRFTSPHPKDFPRQVLELIAERPNICKQLHMPAQSGSSSVLERMRRGYTREAYVGLIEEARSLMPNLAITTDVISGFCGETDEEHQQTVSLMSEVGYDQAFMFAYSERTRTHAHHAMKDDVPEQVKLARLQQVIDGFRGALIAKAPLLQGTEQVVLVEGASKRSTAERPQVSGRSDSGKVCVWEPVEVRDGGGGGGMVLPKVGDYVRAKVVDAQVGTLHVQPIEITKL